MTTHEDRSIEPTPRPELRTLHTADQVAFQSYGEGEMFLPIGMDLAAMAEIQAPMQKTSTVRRVARVALHPIETINQSLHVFRLCVSAEKVHVDRHIAARLQD